MARSLKIASFINSFNGGIATQLVSSRSDIDGRNSFCEDIENFQIYPFGGISKRKGSDFRVGTELTGENATSNMSKRRLIEFRNDGSNSDLLTIHSNTSAGKCGINVHLYNSNGEYVTGTFFLFEESKRTFSSIDFFVNNFRTSQINDYMIVTCPSFSPINIIREENDILTVEFSKMKNSALGSNMSSSDTNALYLQKIDDNSGDYVLGGPIPLDSQDRLDEFSLSVTNKTYSVRMTLLNNDTTWNNKTISSNYGFFWGRCTFTTSGFPRGGTVEIWYENTSTVPIDVNNPSNTPSWKKLADITTISASNFSQTISFPSAAQVVMIVKTGNEITGGNAGWGSMGITLSQDNQTQICRFEPRGDYGASGLRVRPKNESENTFWFGIAGSQVGRTFGDYIATALFRPSAMLFSDYSGTDTGKRPYYSTFCNQRLVFAATDGDRQRVFLSKANDFFNFDDSTGNDTDAFNFSVASDIYERIVWIKSFQNRLIIGTTAGVWSVISDGGVFTLKSITTRKDVAVPCAPIEPELIDVGLIFVEGDKRKVSQLVYDYRVGSFGIANINELSRSIFDNDVVSIQCSSAPYLEVFALMTNGSISRILYDRTNEIRAAGRMTFPERNCLDMAIVRSGSFDSLYCYSRAYDEYMVSNKLSCSIIERFVPQMDYTKNRSYVNVDYGLDEIERMERVSGWTFKSETGGPWTNIQNKNVAFFFARDGHVQGQDWIEVKPSSITPITSNTTQIQITFDPVDGHQPPDSVSAFIRYKASVTPFDILFSGDFVTRMSLQGEIEDMYIQVFNTVGIDVLDRNGNILEKINFREFGDPINEKVPAKTMNIATLQKRGFDDDTWVQFSHSEDAPCTIISFSATYRFTEK